MYNDSVYESFEEIFEEVICDLEDGTIEHEDLVIEYCDCKLEKVLDRIDIEEIVMGLVEDRDDEEGITSSAIIKLFQDNMNVEKIMQEMPSLYYPDNKTKTFDLRELDDYKEYLNSKEAQNEIE
ncbi:hypothetical protein [Sphingobacterium sp. UT-1RO-CII-1]|uniref:hypothetical protein n=1 Tax=Sphingobacterium sp. UT-1RO-CII-1 TaxID=2995225 RepID=UPI00227C57FF|nr:hypothetical protein [Sphingobacterium sp. UT-1RO-CII-1]